jgi:hypothetical protein
MNFLVHSQWRACAKYGWKDVSALTEEAVDVRRSHPDEVALKSSMLVDPSFNVCRIGGPERCRCSGQMREMKPEACGWSDADSAVGDMAQEHSAGGLARPDDAHANALAAISRPAGVIIGDASPVIVGASNEEGKAPFKPGSNLMRSEPLMGSLSLVMVRAPRDAMF